MNNTSVKDVIPKTKRTVVFANDIRKTILNLADLRGPGNLFYPVEVAKLLDPENWQALIDQVQLVAESLISEGQIKSTTSGKALETAYTKRN